MDGVHIGQDDGNIQEIRKRIGGITLINKNTVTDTGADGTAIKSAINISENPGLAAEMKLK